MDRLPVEARAACVSISHHIAQLEIQLIYEPPTMATKFEHQFLTWRSGLISKMIQGVRFTYNTSIGSG